MVGELAYERRPRGHRRVVWVRAVRVGRSGVAVHRRVEDERLRPGREVVMGIEDPPRHAHLHERRPNCVSSWGKGRQLGEQPPEELRASRRSGPQPGLRMGSTARALTGDKRSRSGGPRRGRNQTGACGSHPGQELPASRAPLPGVVLFIGSFLVLRAHCRSPFSCRASGGHDWPPRDAGRLRMPGLLSQDANCLLRASRRQRGPAHCDVRDFRCSLVEPMENR